ncbi:MAG: hypothetical protein KJ070_18460 [Verrucomicrobia bacterium]|nr:hypothetical protein [Verrucomicrobiota bacterium]
MNLQSHNPRKRVTGILLLECVVYLGVLMVILAVGGTAFYLCWDNARDLRRNADDITRTVRAGERWRADIRSATGPIVVQAEPDGEVVRIPSGTNEILYAFNFGAVGRKLASADDWTILLPRVKSSHMQPDDRTHVQAWRWELELTPGRKKPGVRPLFTFQAVPPVLP